MRRDLASGEIPRLTYPDGRGVGLLLSGPPGLVRPWRRAVARLRQRRLPAMIAAFGDGRRFAIDAGDVMYSQIYRLGEYEPAVTQLVRELLRPGDVAVDVGANHGWHSLVMGRATAPGGRVYAIEPLPPAVTALRRNLALNPDIDVEVHPVAVGEREGTLELHQFHDLPHGHASAATLGRNRYDTYVVPCKRLDALVDARPALVKVDVEGFEPEVVAGATAFLGEGDGPMWLIEVNEETAAAFERRPDAALATLVDHGYSIFRVEDGGVAVDRDVASAPHGSTWLCVPDVHLERVPA